MTDEEKAWAAWANPILDDLSWVEGIPVRGATELPKISFAKILYGPSVPLTRVQRVRRWVAERKRRIADAWAVLRGEARIDD